MKIFSLLPCSNKKDQIGSQYGMIRYSPSVVQVQKLHWNLRPPSMNTMNGHMYALHLLHRTGPIWPRSTIGNGNYSHNTTSCAVSNNYYCSDQSSAGAVRETIYRRRPGLPGLRTHLEQPARQRDISPVSVNLPSVFKNIYLFQASFPDIIIDPQ